jgi:hypothetical protein
MLTGKRGLKANGRFCVARIQFAVSMICQVLLAGLASAQGTTKPSQAEIAAIKTCLDGGGRDTSYRDCVGRAVDVCLAADLTGGVVYTCQQREIAIWEDSLNGCRLEETARRMSELRGLREWAAQRHWLNE